MLVQNNLKGLIATDPVPNLVIPLWAIVAYLILVLSPGWRAHPPAAIAHQTPKGIQITTILSLALLNCRNPWNWLVRL